VSTNGVLVENLAEVTYVIIINTDNKCIGETTWNRGSQKSVIDYVLCTENIYEYVESLYIDENQQYSIGSDHNFLILKMNCPAIVRTSPQKQDKCENMSKWNIKCDTDWDCFQNAVDRHFLNWDCETYTDIDKMWSDFKDKLLEAGRMSIGHKMYNSKRDYWDKEIDKLIKSRRDANRMYRLWSQNPNSSPELLNMLWDDYINKKKQVSTHVKQNAIAHKLKVITKNASKAAKKTRSYWNMLKRMNKASNYPLRIRDPEDHNIIIDDPVIIKRKLTEYWANLGNSKESVDTMLPDRL
jgi:hypothetical protein